MKIDTRSRGIDLTEALRRHVARRLGYALGAAGDIVQRVSVMLSDENGPRGGIDKRCLVCVTLDGMPALFVSDTQSDLYVAIDRAADRAARTLSRRLGRQRTPALESIRSGPA